MAQGPASTTRSGGWPSTPGWVWKLSAERKVVVWPSTASNVARCATPSASLRATTVLVVPKSMPMVIGFVAVMAALLKGEPVPNVRARRRKGLRR